MILWTKDFETLSMCYYDKGKISAWVSQKNMELNFISFYVTLSGLRTHLESSGAHILFDSGDL